MARSKPNMTEEQRTVDPLTGEVLETVNIQENIITQIDRWPKVVTGLDPLKELELRGKLAFKLSQAYQKVSAVLHDDKNTEHKYSFASAETIYKTCRNGMAEVGLAVIPFMGSYLEVPILKNDNSGERRGAYLQVNFDYCLIDSETGYTVVIPWIGEVMEYGDKAFNKASTNATKYMLRTLFLLPTDKEEDPDRNSEEGRPGTQEGNSRQDRGRGRNQPQNPPQNAQQAPAEKSEEQKAKEARGAELFKLSYPAAKDEKAEGYAEQREQAKAFMAKCKETGYSWIDVIIYAAAKGKSAHQDLMFYAGLPALDGVKKTETQTPGSGESKPSEETVSGTPKTSGQPEEASQGTTSSAGSSPKSGDPKALKKEFDKNPGKMEVIKRLDALGLSVEDALKEAVDGGATTLVQFLEWVDEREALAGRGR